MAKRLRIGHRHEQVEPVAGFSGIDDLRGELGAVEQVGGPAGDDQRRTRIEKYGIAIGAFLAVEDRAKGGPAKREAAAKKAAATRKRKAAQRSAAAKKAARTRAKSKA